MFDISDIPTIKDYESLLDFLEYKWSSYELEQVTVSPKQMRWIFDNVHFNKRYMSAESRIVRYLTTPFGDIEVKIKGED